MSGWELVLLGIILTVVPATAYLTYRVLRVLAAPTGGEERGE